MKKKRITALLLMLALLVSMLDNSVLSLANNDLSIDNIKLALSDIMLSNELDGATMYANIINEESEPELMAFGRNGEDKTPQGWADIRMFEPWDDTTKRTLNPYKNGDKEEVTEVTAEEEQEELTVIIKNIYCFKI